MNLVSLLRSAQPQELSIAQPAAGAEWSTTVPVGQMWRVDTIYVVFTASAAVANRLVQLTITDGSNIVYATPFNSTAITASTNMRFSYSRLGPDQQQGTGVVSQFHLPDVWLPAGYVIGSTTAAKDVADQYSAVHGLVSVSTDT